MDDLFCDFFSAPAFVFRDPGKSLEGSKKKKYGKRILLIRH